MKSFLVAATIIVFVLPGLLKAGEIEADLLQVKLNRLYFSVGDEAMVFPDASFVLICGTDTLAHGSIDITGPGMAASHPDISFSKLADESDCHAIIETAEIDSISTIRIGVLTDTEKLCGRLIKVEDTTRAIQFVSFPNKIDLAVALDSGSVDLALTLNDIPVNRSATRFESAAPLIAVMIPNPSSEINDHALLTTSLYYRYSSPTSSMFDGLSPAIEYCLYPRAQVCRREYPYDPAGGRRLAARLKNDSAPITIAYADPSLEKSALFFADILARDRIATEFSPEDGRADLILSYFDFDPDAPTTGLTKIVLFLKLLADDSNETLISAGNNIAEAERTDSSACRHYCDLASSRLVQEIGVFPLFRINYQITKQSNISNLQFSRGGALLVDSLVKIMIPAKEGEQ